MAPLGLADGFLSFNTSVFAVQLVKDSQTLYSLKPRVNNTAFDFIPADQMTGDTSAARKPVVALPISGSTLAAANLSPTLPSNSLLNITRQWTLEKANCSYSSPSKIRKPLLLKSIFTGRTAAQTNELCSLFDPYIGQDAGYVQLSTPLLGTLPPPLWKGWRFLPESTSAAPYYQSQTFEALYEWQFHTLAYSQNEWAGVTPWNAPTSAILQPGETRTYGIEFRLAPSIRQIEQTVRSAGRPIAAGTAKLFLNYISPSGALTWLRNSDAKSPSWIGYDITAKSWGRARLSIVYADGTLQTAATEAVSDLGSFLTTAQWFNLTTDPFKRSPSVISYDREVDAFVSNDPRAWIPGLSDEAGAGSWLAAAMKQYAQPNAAEVAKIEQFINQTLWGSIQNADGSVKKSVYFYEPALVPNYTYPSSIDWGNWWSWNQAASFATDRAYDYIHVTATYWASYRVARNYPALVKTHTWQWYLNQAVLTVLTMTNGQVGYADDGLMGETVLLYLLDDLKREGLDANATLVESRMQSRATVWAGERYPFGSEMAWDSTGQEGIYAWSKYFGNNATAENALNAILAYQPLIAHWGYNGNARRYWDNIYGGKLQRIERQIHHYGSGLNALPLVSEFETSPSDFYLLRVGFAGLSGPLSNIDQGGFASASFIRHAMGMGTYIISHPDFGWQAFGGNVISTSPTIQVQIRDSIRRRVYLAPLGTGIGILRPSPALFGEAGAFDIPFTNGIGKVILFST
ncbi:hypothetical protein BJ912DRAFT_1028539 [Pholiota molesta]|nr:hypothetical protein BJ912DRAFT_1028539 [Pholiota molesta]